MKRAVADDTRQFMIMAIVTIYKNVETLEPETIAALAMMDDEDLIYELGETAITLSKHIADTVSTTREITGKTKIVVDGSI